MVLLSRRKCSRPQGPVAHEQSAARLFSSSWIERQLGGAERRGVIVLICGFQFARGRKSRKSHPQFPQRRIRRIVEHHGGRFIESSDTVVQFFWGFPRSEEGDARRAVMAALRVVSESPTGFEIRCTVDTAHLVVEGGVSSAAALDLSPRPRIAAEQGPGEEAGAVIVSQAVKLLMGSGFELASVGSSFTPERFRVLGANTRRAMPRQVSIIGHHAEREAILACWRRVLGGEPECLAITGEAGIGKSTILRLLQRACAATGGIWIEIGCLPETRQVPLYGLLQCLRQLHSEPQTGLADMLEAGSVAGHALMDEVLDLTSSPLASEHDSTGTSRQAMLTALVFDWLRSSKRARPIALVFEDLHWADAATIEFVAALGSQLEQFGGLCLAWTSRRSQLAGFERTAACTPLALCRLSAAEIGQIVAGLPQSADLPAGLTEKIVDRSEGVPLFAKELARLCKSVGATKNIDLLLEPGPLNAVLFARLDALGELRPFAQAAAVIGRDFDSTTLAAALKMEHAQLADGLARLVEEGILERFPGRWHTNTFRFSHALLRDAAYASILEVHRRGLHKSIAEFLSRDAARESDHSPEIVAGHFAAAKDDRSAFSWWCKAGWRAVRLSASRSAVEHFRRALAARARDPAAGTLAQEVDILRALGVQLAGIHGNAADEVLEICQRCLNLSRPLGGSIVWDATWMLHSCLLVRGNVTKALEIGARLVCDIDQNGSDERRMRVHRVQGLAQMLAGRLEVAFSHYAVVLDLYSEARHASLRFQNASDQGAVAHAHMAWGKAIARCPKSSTHHAERALALASRLQHPHTSAHVMCVLAARAQTVGDRHNASALAFAGKSLSQRYEFPYWLAWANIILGWAQVDRGGDGLAKIDAAIKSYARTGAQQAVPYALLLYAEAALAAGRPKCALSAVHDGWRIAHENGLFLYAAELFRARAKAEMQLGADMRTVSGHLKRAHALASRQKAHLFRARAKAALKEAIVQNDYKNMASVL